MSDTPITDAVSMRDTIFLLLMGDPVEGMTRMQKYLFLAQQGDGGPQPDEEPQDFEPYRFGPYSSSLYDDLEMLENLGLITSEPTGDLSATETEETELAFDYLLGDDEREWAMAEQATEVYAITPDGDAFVKRHILPRVSSAKVEQIRRVKAEFANYSLKALLRHVYSSYSNEAAEND